MQRSGGYRKSKTMCSSMCVYMFVGKILHFGIEHMGCLLCRLLQAVVWQNGVDSESETVDTHIQSILPSCGSGAKPFA